MHSLVRQWTTKKPVKTTIASDRAHTWHDHDIVGHLLPSSLPWRSWSSGYVSCGSSVQNQGPGRSFSLFITFTLKLNTSKYIIIRLLYFHKPVFYFAQVKAGKIPSVTTSKLFLGCLIVYEVVRFCKYSHKPEFKVQQVMSFEVAEHKPPSHRQKPYRIKHWEGIKQNLLILQCIKIFHKYCFMQKDPSTQATEIPSQQLESLNKD